VIGDVMTDALTSRGFSYTPGSSGLTLQPFSVSNMKVSELFRKIEDITGYTIEATPDQEIVFLPPGSTSAPSSITDTTRQVQDLSWEDDDEVAPTTVVVLCGPDGTLLTSQEWIADGSEAEWVTDL